MSFDIEASTEAGLPFYFRHFSPQEYQQFPQNWAVVQDLHGVIYAGNLDGILAYDGSTWELIRTATNTVVRSLAVDAQGVIYAGAVGDFGYLMPDSLGSLQYVSLIDQVPPAYREFQDVWGTHVTSEGVYFQTPERIFRWDGNEIKAWNSEAEFRTSFVVRDQFYVREHGTGLVQVVGDTIQRIPGGENFADMAVFVMAPYDEERLLIGTRDEKLLLYDGQSVVPFPTEADRLLDTYRLYHGRALGDGLFALALLDGGGVAIIDRDGRLVERIDQSMGLRDSWVNYVYPDAQGGLWMALNDQGIVRADVPSSLSIYDERRGLHGIIYSIQRHQGHLYVATSKGLFVLRKEPENEAGSPPRYAFTQIDHIRGAVWTLLPTDSVLFAATNMGLFAIREVPELLTRDGEKVFTLRESEIFEGRIYLGMKEGLGMMHPTSEGWKITRHLGAINKEILSIVEEENGALWISTIDGDIARVTFPEGRNAPSVTWLNEREGLPEGEVQITSLLSQTVFVSLEGIYRFKKAESEQVARFYQDTVFSEAVGVPGDSLRPVHADETGTVWLVHSDQVHILTPRPDGSYEHQAPAALRFPKERVVRVYVEEDGVAWIGNGSQLIRYDPGIARPYDQLFAALIREVRDIGNDKLLYGGTQTAAGVRTTFDPGNDNLRFEVAAPSFNGENEYQYYLEGRDAGWSPWMPQWSRTYYNLGPRSYTLHVRARNAQGIVSQEATFAFHIVPPWYRTWWAYALYVIGLLAISALSWRYYTMVQEHKEALEQARELARERYVNERLTHANQRLQEANEGLTQANQMKDEFLATTSHELRTPLTAILGFSAILLEELPDEYRMFLDPIESNGQRLLRTVNSLLDIARLRAGMMEASASELNVCDQVNETVRLLAPLAQQKDLPIEIVCPPRPLYIYVDGRLFERVLNNLIGNAIKFTQHGYVRVEVQEHDGQVQVHVRDTGVGIDATFLPHLFDEFKQESTGLARLHEGTGLGLAITKRLVDLMGGTITVESKKDEGSVFTVTFPACVPPARSARAPSRMRGRPVA